MRLFLSKFLFTYKGKQQIQSNHNLTKLKRKSHDIRNFIWSFLFRIIAQQYYMLCSYDIMSFIFLKHTKIIPYHFIIIILFYFIYNNSLHVFLFPFIC